MYTRITFTLLVGVCASFKSVHEREKFHLNEDRITYKVGIPTIYARTKKRVAYRYFFSYICRERAGDRPTDRPVANRIGSYRIKKLRNPKQVSFGAIIQFFPTPPPHSSLLN